MFNIFKSKKNDGCGCNPHDEVSSGAVLLDVRTESEFASGHLPGAVNIPLALLKERVTGLIWRDKPVVVYCRSGGRSARAAEVMRNRGYESICDLGAMGNWR